MGHNLARWRVYRPDGTVKRNIALLARFYRYFIAELL